MISNELIKSLTPEEEKPKHVDRWKGTKFIHLKKEFFLKPDIEGPVVPIWSLDGKTFNGKDYLITNRFGNRYKFDGVTIAYKLSNDGYHLDVTFITTNPADEYVKRIGANITGVSLIEYQMRGWNDEWGLMENFPGVCSISIPTVDIIRDARYADDTNFSDIRTYDLVQEIKKRVVYFLMFGNSSLYVQRRFWKGL